MFTRKYYDTNRYLAFFLFFQARELYFRKWTRSGIPKPRHCKLRLRSEPVHTYYRENMSALQLLSGSNQLVNLKRHSRLTPRLRSSEHTHHRSAPIIFRKRFFKSRLDSLLSGNSQQYTRDKFSAAGSTATTNQPDPPSRGCDVESIPYANETDRAVRLRSISYLATRVRISGLGKK